MSDFNIGDLVASIRLDGAEKFNSDVNRAKGALAGSGEQAGKLGSALKTTAQTAAVMTTAITAATAGWVTSLFRAGASYNTLQQTSRAALKTILGGTQAANDQMAKMDDFARSSPFSKGTFLQAQQQMLGFGIEAKKVIPYLQSIQDAVAATGGSNQQIADLTLIMSQISAAGKITGQDLLQFGQRGVNAAQLIGDQMGLTGAQVKDKITNGALDAGKALDALAAGMEKTYGGAAAGVKATWTGTVDRIKAANRDIGAALAEPFISQQGGGMAVTWGNQVADVLRAIQSQAAPVVGILTTRLSPVFVDLTNTLAKAAVVVKSWDSNRLEQFLTTATQYGPAVAAIGGSLVGLNADVLRLIPGLDRLVPKIGLLPSALVAVALASPDTRAALMDLLRAFEPLVPIADELGKVVAQGLNEALPVAADVIESVAAVATPLVRTLSEIPAPVLAGVAAFVALSQGVKPIMPLLEGVVGQGARFIQFMQNLREASQVQAALGAMEGNTSRFAGALGVASIAVNGLGQGLKAAFVTSLPALAILGVVTAASTLVSAFAAQAQEAAEANTRVAQYKDTLTATGQATKDTANAISQNLTKVLGDSWGVAGNTTSSLLKMGLSIDQVSQAAAKGGPAYDKLIDQLTRTAGANDKVNAAQRQFSTDTTGASSSIAAWVKSQHDGTGAAGELLDQLKKSRAEVQLSEKVTRMLAEAQHAAAAGMTDDARSYQRFSAALDIISSASATADEKLHALDAALDELTGGSKSAAQQQIDLAQTVLDVKSALSDGHAWIDASGNIDTLNQSGLSFAKQLGSIDDQMKKAAQSAYDYATVNGKDVTSAVAAATAAGQTQVDSLRATMRAAGLTDAQIDSLIGKYLSVPSEVSTVIALAGMDDASRRVGDILLQMAAIPGQKSIAIDAPTADVMNRLRALGVEVSKPKDGKITVTLTGQQTVQSILNQLTQPKTVPFYAKFISSGGVPALLAKSNADGNLYSAGHAQAFEDGGFASGIYAGRPGGIHKFAEPETGWEAYISGKPAAKVRNQKIAAEAVSRLGGVAAFSSGGLVAPNVRIPMPMVPVARPQAGAGSVDLEDAFVRALMRVGDGRTGANLTINVSNPVSRDPVQDVRSAGQQLASLLTL
jgi:tape measure domain-containing protein